MTKLATSPDAFERQIQRIYQLLADSGAEVSWNDHIRDPDNPIQPRQIDVSIKRDGILTLVECRQQKSRQDVQWIEELMGRRTSLGAHEIIAVSSSGFTAGARAKAGKHGVILRDLQGLSDQEVARWGQRVVLTLFFYQYSELEVSLLVDRHVISQVSQEQIQTELGSHPCLQSLFNAAASVLTQANLVADDQPGRTVEFGVRLQFDAVQLCRTWVREAKFKGKARLLAQQIAPSLVYSYGEPGTDVGAREATLETFGSLGDTSIAHTGTTISTFIDLSELQIPAFCQFRFWRQEAGQELNHEALELQFGQELEQLKVTGKGLRINLCSA